MRPVDRRRDARRRSWTLLFRASQNVTNAGYVVSSSRLYDCRRDVRRRFSIVFANGLLKFQCGVRASLDCFDSGRRDAWRRISSILPESCQKLLMLNIDVLRDVRTNGVATPAIVFTSSSNIESWNSTLLMYRSLSAYGGCRRDTQRRFSHFRFKAMLNVAYYDVMIMFHIQTICLKISHYLIWTRGRVLFIMLMIMQHHVHSENF